MKAIRVHEQSGVDGLVFEDAPDPVPAVGDVLVRVHAAGFTGAELYWPIYVDRAGGDGTPTSRPTNSRARSSRSVSAPPGSRWATRSTASSTATATAPRPS